MQHYIPVLVIYLYFVQNIFIKLNYLLISKKNYQEIKNSYI